MAEHNIAKIDFLKLDVEGANWHVLDGFGERLRDVRAIHVEAEHGEYLFKDQNKLYGDIAALLTKYDFEQLYFKRCFGMQSDSFWIQKSTNRYAPHPHPHSGF
jgi:hypothetical protein